MEVVIGGVGYRNLRDHSIGVMVSDLLAERKLQPGVVVRDLSFNPVAVSQWLESLPQESRPDRMVMVSATPRKRAPGTITAYRWDRILPPPERIQRAIADAVTGIIDLDNTLIVVGHLGPLPQEIVVVEVEPEIEEFGETLSPTLETLFKPLCNTVLTLAMDEEEAGALPLSPLGGPGAPVASG